MDLVLDLPGDPPQNALVAAAARGDIVEVHRIVASGIDVNLLNTHWGQTALHEASANGRSSVAAALIGAGASLDSLDRNGSTPLMNACSEGHNAVALLLLEHGANATVTREDGMTAYKFALWGACSKVVLRALLDRGAIPPEPGFRVIRLISPKSSLKQKFLYLFSYLKQRALFLFLAAGAIAWGVWITAMTAIGR